MSLRDELASLPEPVQQALQDHQFDAARLERLAQRLGRDEAQAKAANRVQGTVTKPAAGDVQSLPERGTREYERLRELGQAALDAGQVALIVLAGGMATRMGGVVKALVEAIPGYTFLDLQLAARTAGSVPYPLWLMTSYATKDSLGKALAERQPGDGVHCFNQHLSVRLKGDGHLYRDPEGSPSLHAPGHGDLPDALRASGLLDAFIAAGGKMVTIANVDNLGANLDPVVVGFHLDHEAPVTCEVVDKEGSDKGGIPVRWNGRPVVLEELRLPGEFDASSVRVFNTNTFHLDARALNQLDIDWTYFTVYKTVNEQRVVQFERFIGELTSVLDTRFLRVPRHGVDSRFLPVKSNEELAARRDELSTLARGRGWVGGDA